MNFEQKFERIVMCALVGFLLIFAICTGLGTNNARSLLAWYSFFVMSLYIFRGWYFKHPYDKIEIMGCGLVGVVLNALNYFS